MVRFAAEMALREGDEGGRRDEGDVFVDVKGFTQHKVSDGGREEGEMVLEGGPQNEMGEQSW